MDLEDETLADQFLDIANSNLNNTIEEVNDESINANANAELDNAPLTTRQTNNLIHRVPFKRIQLTVQMTTLTKEEITKITSSKRGNDSYQKDAHSNAKLFFKTIMVDPAFKHYLDVVQVNNEKVVHFIKHFRGDKTDDKPNELNAALSYFVLKARKQRIRKKDKGKPHGDWFDSGSLSTMLKRIFTWFSSFEIKYLLREFNKNGGFTAVIEAEWKKIAKKDSTFGVGCYAAVYDRHGDEKMRLSYVVIAVFSDNVMFISMTAMQTQRCCAFRGQTEPTSLQWDLVIFGVEEDPNSAFFGVDYVLYSNLERKNGQMTVKRPRREKNDHQMKAHANPNDVHCLVKMMKLLRDYSAPHQVNAFCQPAENGQLHMNKHYYNPHKPTSKKQYTDMVRAISAYSGFDDAERATAHGPRKHVSDLMGYYGVPLG